jgi:D-cysteine desulfhydrase
MALPESRARPLHERFPATRERLPCIPLCRLPTPVRAAPGLGDGVWLKDDARSAEPWGGNKPRKLEWILADAKARGYRTILTFGGLGTNHGLATALYARREGLRCVLALVDQPRTEEVERQLARLRAAATRVYLTRTGRRTKAVAPWLLLRHAQPRPPRPPYLLPPGGSSPLGSLGFVDAALELAGQVRAGELPEPAAVYLALGSGGSAAGLAAGFALAGMRTRVEAVVVNDQLKLSQATVLRLARRALRLLESRGADLGGAQVRDDAVRMIEGHMGAGYGHATPGAGRAQALAAEAEGLALEPVYTSKALAALLAERPAGPVLFWNTHSDAGAATGLASAG